MMTTSTETEFFHKCRVCLQQGTIQIFGEQYSGIPQHLKLFGEIDITEDDNYPKYLCEHCLNSLNVAIQFRQTAKKTQILLQKLEQSSDKKLSQIYAQEEIEVLNTLEELDDITSQSSDEGNVYKNCKEEGSCSDFEEHQSNISSSADKNINQSCKKDGIDHKNSLADQQVVPDRLTHNNNEFKSLWKEEIESSNNSDLKLQKCVNENIKDEDIKFLSTSNIQQTSCVNKNTTKMNRKAVKLKGSKRSVTSKQYTKETITNSCSEEDINNLKASEVRAHCAKYFQAIQVGDEFNYKCNICKKTVLRKHSRSQHLVAHLSLSEFSFVCEVCGKQFVRKGELQQHSSIHYVNPVFKCDMCPYRGHTRGLLRCHKKVHSDQFKYHCTICPKKFKSNSNLHVHLRRHGKPMFPCEKCHKSFYENASLKKHVESQHLGIKKLSKCDQCGKEYSERKKMLEHQNKVHKREKVYNRAHYLIAKTNLS